MKRVLRASVFPILMAATQFAGPRASATERVWAAAVDGVYTDATKWTGGVAPATTDDISFKIAANPSSAPPYSVTFPGNTIIQPVANYLADSVYLDSNRVTFLPSSQLNRGPSTFSLSGSLTLTASGQGTQATLNSAIAVLSAHVITIGSGFNGNCTLNLNAGRLTADYLEIGDEERGILNVAAGTTVNNTGGTVLGYFNKASGSLNINNASWSNNSDTIDGAMVIGDNGTGQMSIRAGGKVDDGYGTIAKDSEATGVSSVTVTDAGSVWTNRKVLTVGGFNSASLEILSGGQVTSDSALIGPTIAKETGIVELSNASTFNQNTDLTIGGTTSFTSASGSGTLNISSGSVVTTGRNAFVGSMGTGTVAMIGASSKWNIAGALNVANSGIVLASDHSALNVADILRVGDDASASTNTATVTIDTAATVSTRVTFVAPTAAARGKIIVDGTGTTWSVTDQLYVGFLGTGTFQILEGGQVTSSQAELGTSDGASGTMVVDGPGSNMSTSLGMNVGAVGTGKLTVSHGGTVTATGLFNIGSKGTVEGNSTISANIQNSGTVAPGIASANPTDAFGTLQLTGNYTQKSTGLLCVDLQALAAHDQLAVQGTATLAGTLEVDLPSGFAPNPGDRFTILSSTSRTGTFATSTFQNNPAFHLITYYTPTTVDILASAVGEKTWGVDADGNSSLASNWIGGPPGAIGDIVAFSTAITSDRTVTVDTSFVASQIYFDGAKNYTVAGQGAITLAVSGGNTASLTVKDLHGAGNHVISAPLTLTSNTNFEIAPSSSLKISQPMNSGGVGLTKTGAGTLALKNVRADSLTDNAGTVQIISGGGAAGTGVVKSLTIAPAARLDITNNDLLVDYSGATPYSTIRNYVIAGIANGKTGIISSTAQKAGNTIDAVVDNALLHLTAWNGIQVDDTTIITKYTLRGDANLDSTVGFADLVAVAQNYGNNTGQATWTQGDFNYDGNVDFADLVAVAQNYGAALPAQLPGASPDFNADLAQAGAVPEPSVFILAFAGIAVMPRTRRR